jgi:hypothetical protein
VCIISSTMSNLQTNSAKSLKADLSDMGILSMTRRERLYGIRCAFGFCISAKDPQTQSLRIIGASDSSQAICPKHSNLPPQNPLLRAAYTSQKNSSRRCQRAHARLGFRYIPVRHEFKYCYRRRVYRTRYTSQKDWESYRGCEGLYYESRRRAIPNRAD